MQLLSLLLLILLCVQQARLQQAVRFFLQYPQQVVGRQDA
jgi:hypothetical protein